MEENVVEYHLQHVLDEAALHLLRRGSSACNILAERLDFPRRAAKFFIKAQPKRCADEEATCWRTLRGRDAQFRRVKSGCHQDSRTRSCHDQGRNVPSTDHLSIGGERPHGESPATRRFGQCNHSQPFGGLPLLVASPPEAIWTLPAKTLLGQGMFLLRVGPQIDRGERSGERRGQRVVYFAMP